MSEKFIRAEELAEIMEISVPYAYKIIKQLNEELDAKFVKEAAEAGFVNLKGHRKVGGMRASIYNAMPSEGIDKLVDFMEKFRKENA